MKKTILTVIVIFFCMGAFSQITCNKLFEVVDAVKNLSIKGKQINKNYWESTIVLDEQIDSYISIDDEVEEASFIFLETYSETEAINKFKELKKLLEKCKPNDWGERNSEKAYSIHKDRFTVVAYYYYGTKSNPGYTVQIMFSLDIY